MILVLQSLTLSVSVSGIVVVISMLILGMRKNVHESVKKCMQGGALTKSLLHDYLIEGHMVDYFL